MISRREALRLGSVMVAAGVLVATFTRGGAALQRSHSSALLSANVARSSAARKVEIHFTGKQTFARLIAQAQKENWSTLAMGEVVGRVATYLRETPYVNHTLDHSADNEYCIVNLQELDCVTFVETTLALSRMIKLGLNSPDDLAKQIQLFRYRDGVCDGFTSRLHYMSDWLYDNNRRGLISIYTKQLAGTKNVKKDISLMSSRPDQYVQLRKHPEWIPAIAKDERAIAARTLIYVPRTLVAENEKTMQTGDVIAITTSADILDCAHTGFCYRDENGVLRFLHASWKHKKVWLDEELAKYLATVHGFTGIMVARPKEPAVLQS